MSITLNKQQQQQFAQRINDELEKITMSWDHDLRLWWNTALHALNFASAVSIGIPQEKYAELFSFKDTGLGMNTVALLCNNLEARTPAEMGQTARDWIAVLELNHKIAERWKALKLPAEKKVYKEFEIMNGVKPANIIKMGEA